MLASITTQIPVTRMRESVRAIINLAHFWSNTRLFPPLRPRYTPLHDVTGAGETVLNASVSTSVRGSQSGGISTRGVWCHVPYVYCAENSADGIPVLWKLNTMKANVRCFTIVSAITECWHSKFRHVRYVLFGESLQKHSKSIANRRVEDWEASNGHTKDTTPLFHGPWHDPSGEHICAQPFRMWNRLRLTNISETQKRCK